MCDVESGRLYFQTPMIFKLLVTHSIALNVMESHPLPISEPKDNNKNTKMYLEWREVRTTEEEPKKGVARTVHRAC